MANRSCLQCSNELTKNLDFWNLIYADRDNYNEYEVTGGASSSTGQGLQIEHPRGIVSVVDSNELNQTTNTSRMSPPPTAGSNDPPPGPCHGDVVPGEITNDYVEFVMPDLFDDVNQIHMTTDYVGALPPKTKI